MRVASLDMRDNNAQCPSGLRENSFDGISTCVSRLDSDSCSSDTFSTYNLNYSNVCGKIIAYQFGRTQAFKNSRESIDSVYVDGVSLTHGTPRQHIWTFAIAVDEVPSDRSSVCPCFTVNDVKPPTFVGTDYFCDTGSPGEYSERFYGDDPVWDGDGCGGTNMCCSFNTPPWFHRKLPPATDDIQMRVCKARDPDIADIAIQIKCLNHLIYSLGLVTINCSLLVTFVFNYDYMFN